MKESKTTTSLCIKNNTSVNKSIIKGIKIFERAGQCQGHQMYSEFKILKAHIFSCFGTILSWVHESK